MNRVTYRRWKDFAMRMAEKGWPAEVTEQREHQAGVIPSIIDFFGCLERNCEEDIIRFESWDETRTDYRHAEEMFWGWRGNDGPFICDIVAELLSEYYNPFYWNDEEYEAWDDEWGSRIRCCLRAGIDMAGKPTDGVEGFLKADLMRMYPDGVPKWVRNGWEKWNEIPDDAALWL